MHVLAPNNIIWVVLLALAVGACTIPVQKRHFEYTDTSQKEVDVKVWPPAGAMARYSYVGELTGEDNLKVTGRTTRRGMHKLFAGLVGLDAAEPDKLDLQRPLAGVIDSHNRIYVTDAGRQAVFVFDQDKGTLTVWDHASANTRFQSPVGIALGKDNELLVTDSVLGEVIRLAYDGAPIGSFGRNILKRPTGLARDPHGGLIYVSDSADHDVKVFNDAGALVQVIGYRGTRLGEFNSPTYLAFNNNRLYVSDTLNARIQVLTTMGDAVQEFGQRGLYVGNLTRPKGIAVDSSGNVYVVESYYDHLLVFNTKGRLLLPIGGAGKAAGQFFQPAGVWVDSQDRVYVADMLNGRIAVFQYLGEN